MKKFVYTIIALVAVAASCNKVDSESPVTSSQKENTTSVEKVFSVIVPETKTELGNDGVTMKWSSDDKINIIAGTTGNQYTFNIHSGAGTSSATFSGTLDAADASETQFYAVYPDVNVSVSSTNIEFLASSADNHLKYYTAGNTVKAIAGGFDPAFAPMTAVAGSNDELSFRYGCAFFKFKVAEAGISQIEFSTDGGGRVNGRPKFETATGDNTGVESAQKSIIIAPEIGTFSVSETYYLPILTKQSKFGVLTLKYTKENGSSKSISMSAFQNVVLAAGKIYNLGTPPVSFAPEINSSDLSIEAEDENGTITFSVENLVDGGTVSYSVSDDGLSNSNWGTVSYDSSTGNGSISFTCDANTDTNNTKTATVTLTYTYETTKTVSKIVTVTQKKAVASGTNKFYYYNTGSVTNTNGKFSASTSYITFDGTNNNCGVSSFSINGVSCTKGLKLDGSGYLDFTTSDNVTVSLTFYYAARKSSANDAAVIQITPTDPAGSATEFGNFNTFGTINSQTITLNASTKYRIARKSSELALVYVELSETPTN
ncbi:MAG: BACON domain-containing protein [Bacteroidales bacterium]|nr:BACON domain-containing protein [Bacteroidales bacterium]